MKQPIKLLQTLFFSILAIVWIIPVALTIINASKSVADFSRGNIWTWPTEFALFQNLADAWNMGDLGRGFVNSIGYGLSGSIFGILLSAAAAYGLIILRIRGAFYWFLVIYCGSIFPVQMFLVPLFVGYRSIGLYNTYSGMILFYTAMSIPFATFVLRNYLKTIPFEVVEAARLDGCTDLQLFARIISWMLLAPCSVLMLFSFTWIWNDLVFAMTLTASPKAKPVMAGLAALAPSPGSPVQTGLTTILAGALLVSLPTIILFFSLQRNFIQGLTITSSKI